LCISSDITESVTREPGSQDPSIQITPFFLPSFVTLGKVQNFSVPSIKEIE
jgi:hypothetical protein